MIKPETTLFMLMSVDEKISTGDTDDRDLDKDFPLIVGIKDGLDQYYRIERTTDLFSMNSGRVMAKVGINDPATAVAKTPVSFIIIDSKPHLDEVGVDNLLRKARTLYIVTTNKGHPAYRKADAENLRIIGYEGSVDFIDLFRRLKEAHGVDRMTIQTGGTLNSILLRRKLIDKVSLVVAPALVGGRYTSTLVDGESLRTRDELKNVKALRLTDVIKLDESYIQLKYDLMNETSCIGG